MIFIAGQAKSGSTWVAQMLATLPGFAILKPLRWKSAVTSETWKHFQATNLYEGIFDEFRHQLAVVKWHTWGFPENVDLLNQWGMRYLITVRDPRDLLISHYYYAKNFPENWDHPNARDRSLSEYIDFKLEKERWNRESVDWCREWLKNRDPENSHLIKYEDALRDPAGEMRRALDFLGFEISDDQLREIVDQNSFKKMAGRKQGQEDKSSFHRKGIAGDWKNHFSRGQCRSFREQAKDVLDQLGYE